MSRFPLAAIGQPVIIVDFCTFVSGDLISFSNACSNILLCLFQYVSDVKAVQLSIPLNKAALEVTCILHFVY
jgi:hypothetical protein